MLNNKNDLSVVPTINNDGHSYIIPMDMYKEGYWAYNISNYFKARVDDSGTPFMIRWYKHGQLANIQNLRPFIRGKVGGYTIDDSSATADPKIVMDETASSIDWTGETTDTQAGGIAVYQTINECYPQTGIFYGQVGLRSSTGDTVVTGIDVIFKVLDGNVNMIGARQYYVSELTKALLEFQSKMDQHDRDFQAKMDQQSQDFKSQTDKLISNARDAYNQETQNAQDALNAAKAQIQANRDEQQNLSDRLAGTEQQIKIHNVATIDQFTKLSKEALDRLANISAQPKYYVDVNAMKQANPDGTNDLCQTMDDGHRWLYVNGTWQDCGATKDNAFKAALDASQDALYGQNILDWQRAKTGTEVEATEDFAKFGEKPIMHIKSTSSEDWTDLHSPVVAVADTTVSLQVPNLVRDASKPGIAYLELQELKAGDDPDKVQITDDNVKWLTLDNKTMGLQKFENLKLNPDTTRVRINIGINGGTGDLFVGTPMLNYGEKCIPYSPIQGFKDREDKYNDTMKKARYESGNLLYGENILEWYNSDLGTFSPYVATNTDFENKHIIHAHSATATGYVQVVSPVFEVHSHIISLQFPEMVQNATNKQTYVEIQQFADGDNPDDNHGDWHQHRIVLHFGDPQLLLWKDEGIQLLDTTKKIRLNFYMYDNAGDMYVGTPVVNEGRSCIPYDMQLQVNDLKRRSQFIADNSQNLMYGRTIDEVYLATDDQIETKITHEKRDSYPTVDFIHVKTSYDDWTVEEFNVTAVKPGSTISIQLPARNIAGTAVVALQQFEDEWQQDKISEQHFELSNRLEIQKFQNIKLDDKANYIVVRIALEGPTEMMFGMPVINYGSKCIPYNKFYPAESDNIMANGFTFDSSTNVFKMPKEDSTVLSYDTINYHADNPNIDFARIPVDKNVISLQIPYTSTGYFNVQLRYSPTMDDDPDKNLNYTLAASHQMQNYKIEDIELPEDTKSIGLLLYPSDKTMGKLGLPKINYGKTCMPYDKYDVSDAVTSTSSSQPIAQMFISSNSHAYDRVVPFKLFSDHKNTQGYLSFNVQGDSSRLYPKKNFKIKLFKDPEGKNKLKIKVLESWKKNNKFNLKANWIDATQSRNIVNARLVKDAVAVTPLEKPSLTKITNTPDLGQINGIPIEVYFNGEFYGLYTLNTKKDEVTFAMDSKDTNNEVVSIETPQNAFTNPDATIDGVNYLTEIHDKPTDVVNSNFTKFMQFINTATDEEFKAKIGDYIDVTSVITEMLFGSFSHEYDFYAKSILLATWNQGAYWYCIPYDLDSTWALDWNGADIIQDDPHFDFQLALQGDKKAELIGKYENGNKLLSRIYDNFKPQIKAQGQKLRATVWSTPAILAKFREFIDSIPVESYTKELAKWTNIPSADITSFNQLQQYIIKRSQEFDQFLSQLTDQ